jgi:hypothetical protein
MDQRLDLNTNARREQSRKIRLEAADIAFNRPHNEHKNNGDEENIKFDCKPSFLGNVTKSLPHHPDGRVFPAAYQALLHALKTRTPEDFERIPLGPRNVELFDADLETLLAAPIERFAVLEIANTRPPRKLMNPTSGLNFDLEGPDAFSIAVPPAPSILSPQAAAELAELYAMALLRDVWFTDFETSEQAAEVTKAFNLFTDHPIRKFRPQDTPTTLFRGFLPGDEVGPYISQFLFLGTPSRDGKRSPQEGFVDYGATPMDQRLLAGKANLDYLTTWEEWLDAQNGANVVGTDQYEERRFVSTPRDLATYIHDDLGYPAYLNATLVLFGMRAPPSPALPFTTSRTQDGFVTFGPVHLAVLLPEVVSRALKCSWFGKWYVNRRLRPEAMGALAHQQGDGIPHGLDPKLIESKLLADIAVKNGGSRLLPQAFAEGSPNHSAYGGGHAAFAGACATILKAFFDESHEFPAFVPDKSTGGKSLKPFTGSDGKQVMLTVGGEINKLASNLSIGRHMAGVHYFSDYMHPGVLLGEEVAIGILQEQKLTYHEKVNFTFTRFNGEKITI